MSEPRKNTQNGPTVTELMTAAAAIAAGTAAYGEVVRHDNSGTFSWPFNVLDVTVSEADQPGFAGLGDPSTSYQDYFSDFYPTFSYGKSYQSGNGLEMFSAGFSDGYAAPLDANTMIGPGLTDGTFRQYTVFEFAFTACELYYVGDPCYCYYYGKCEDGTRGILPEGVETYLGVRFDVGAGTQYGWIKAVRSFATVEALAWGFETEPGKPIRAGAACDGDLDNDGEVSFSDLTTMLANWGSSGPGAEVAAPFDAVTFADLTELLAKWGPCSAKKLAGGAPPQGTLAALAFGSAPQS